MAIVGLGGIGRAIALCSHAFGLDVVGVRGAEGPVHIERIVSSNARDPSSPIPVTVFPISAIDEVLSMSDVVVLALPLTDQSKMLIDRKRISRLPRGCILINVSRGPIVDEDALIEALNTGRTGGAGLDVFVSEPLTSSSPLWSSPSVIITPHVAGVSESIGGRVLNFFRGNLLRFLAGRELENVVRI